MLEFMSGTFIARIEWKIVRAEISYIGMIRMAWNLDRKMFILTLWGFGLLGQFFIAPKTQETQESLFLNFICKSKCLNSQSKL